MKARTGLFCWGMAVLVLPAAAAVACNVPVFRYALERFESDPFELLIYHRGPLAEEAQAAVAALQKLADDSSSSLQVRVRLVDLAAPAKPVPPCHRPCPPAQRLRLPANCLRRRIAWGKPQYRSR